MRNDLNERKKQILFAIINDYITTAVPVASKTLFKKHKIELSTATIRSVMSDLEEMGLLYHPHTSAGRIPTNTAYQFYVDSLIQVKNISEREKNLIEQRCGKDKMKIEDLMKETSRILSSISNYAGIVLTPKRTRTILKHIDFIRLKERRLLAVLVSKQGIVQNRIIETDDEINESELIQINNYLNSILKDLSIEKIKDTILEEMRKEKVRYDRILSKALKLGQTTMEIASEEPELLIEGESKLALQPEFSDINRLKSILKALERKTLLVELLEKTMNAQGIQIFIGADVLHPDLKDMSLITASYSGENGVLGTLGVIGPTRMNYDRIIPLVDHTAKLLTKLLEE